MLYTLHEAALNSATPLRMAAHAARDFWGSPLNPASASKWGRTLYASADLVANLTRRYGRPAENRHSLQIEVDRRLYMNQKTLQKSDGFEQLKADIAHLIEALRGFANPRRLEE